MSFIDQLFQRFYAPSIVVGSAHASVSVTGTASTLASLSYTAPSGAGGYRVQCQGAPVRYTLDGTNPTTTTGFSLDVRQYADLTPADLATAKWIAESGSPKLEIQALR